MQADTMHYLRNFYGTPYPWRGENKRAYFQKRKRMARSLRATFKRMNATGMFDIEITPLSHYITEARRELNAFKRGYKLFYLKCYTLYGKAEW